MRVIDSVIFICVVLIIVLHAIFRDTISELHYIITSVIAAILVVIRIVIIGRIRKKT